MLSNNKMSNSDKYGMLPDHGDIYDKWREDWRHTEDRAREVIKANVSDPERLIELLRQLKTKSGMEEIKQFMAQNGFKL